MQSPKIRRRRRIPTALPPPEGMQLDQRGLDCQRHDRLRLLRMRPARHALLGCRRPCGRRSRETIAWHPSILALDEVGLVNDLTYDCGPSAPDRNVVGAPVAGSTGVVADDVELVEPEVAAPVNESTWS